MNACASLCAWSQVPEDGLMAERVHKIADHRLDFEVVLGTEHILDWRGVTTCQPTLAFNARRRAEKFSSSMVLAIANGSVKLHEGCWVHYLLHDECQTSSLRPRIVCGRLDIYGV